MQGFSLFSSQHKPTTSERKKIVDFLFEELGKYGDSKAAISKCVAFALQETPQAVGGFVLICQDDDQRMVGAAIVNETGMTDYIPENILVYIAVDHHSRGKGIGGKLMAKIQEATQGDIALHVDPENPARRLYQRMGFTAPYLEMRYRR